MHAKGQDIRSIVLHSSAPGIVVALTNKMAPKYSSVKDLKGAKIGVSAPGSATHLLLNQLLVRNGLKPDDVSVVGIGNAAGAVAAVRTGGELDAIVNYDPVISELVQAVVNGTVRALSWMQTAKAEDIMAAIPEDYWRGQRDLYLSTIRKGVGGFSPDGIVTPGAAKTVYDGLASYDNEVKNAKVDLSKTYDNRFAMNANQKYGKK
jgi:NitT/TauT family transport system substrate-binding protein